MEVRLKSVGVPERESKLKLESETGGALRLLIEPLVDADDSELAMHIELPGLAKSAKSVKTKDRTSAIEAAILASSK